MPPRPVRALSALARNRPSSSVRSISLTVTDANRQTGL